MFILEWRFALLYWWWWLVYWSDPDTVSGTRPLYSSIGHLVPLTGCPNKSWFQKMMKKTKKSWSWIRMSWKRLREELYGLWKNSVESRFTTVRNQWKKIWCESSNDWILRQKSVFDCSANFGAKIQTMYLTRLKRLSVLDRVVRNFYETFLEHIELF